MIRSSKPGGSAFTDTLTSYCGQSNVLLSDRDRSLYSQDLYQKGATPLAVVRPPSVEALSEVVALANDHGISIFARGGGMSYTNAFLPSTSNSIVLDMTTLDSVVQINDQDLFAVVEAGCTWANLDDALKSHGLRAKFWGPFSGFYATVGGSMSQGTTNFGALKHGSSGGTALGFDVVLADGSLLQTGGNSQSHHSAFFRQYGPDLTGIFANDAGALGIKARITLALEKRPVAVGGVSYAVKDFEQVVAAVAAITREELASEIFAVEAAVMEQFMGSGDLKSDVASLLQVERAEANPIRGLAKMARVAVHGRNFLKESKYSVHVVAEGRDQHELKQKLAWIRKTIGEKGIEIPNTMPTVIRAQPFSPLPVLHADGRRMLPMHGILPFSSVLAFHKAFSELHQSMEEQLSKHRVTVAGSFTALGNNAFLYEPVFYWEDVQSEFHQHYTSAEMATVIQSFPPNEAGRQLVADLKSKIVDMLFDHGAVHLQIGKTYPYQQGRSEPFLALLEALKNELDPKGIMNPGALGLAAPTSEESRTQ